MKVPAPAAICQHVSELSARKARESARSMGWSNKTIEALIPLEAESGRVGIRASLRYIKPGGNYIMHQERGTQPYLMWWVQNRTIPMGCGQGDGPHLRTGGHVGEPGYVNIPHVGRVYREQRWRHPGLKPKHFMSQAITDAIKEAQPEIKKAALAMLLGGEHRE